MFISRRSSFRFLIAAVCTAGIYLATQARAAETVGNPLVNRANVDTATGAIFVELQPFTQPGVLSTFGFYADDAGTTGRQLTPLLFEQVGSDFIIRGVGQAVTNAGSGAQTFPFVLSEGSAAVGPNFFFGYKDGTDADPNQAGLIEFDFVPGAPSARFFGTNFANNLDPGVNLGQGTFLGPNINQQERVYSFQATAIPEPAAAALSLLLVVSSIGRRRNRRR